LHGKGKYIVKSKSENSAKYLDLRRVEINKEIEEFSVEG
jgi:hypothetical protein